MAVEIKSSLLNAEDMKNVKNSLVHVAEQDGEDSFRVRLVEYINDTCENNQDMFFYNALIYLRFLNPGSNDVAYTTPEKLIFLNAPGQKDIGKSIRQWEFIYDHECLHQLWDTFGVGDRIKEEKGSYNHKILNIASDCVINDYLYRIRKKERPTFGIFPDVIKKEFGVDYDPKKDTQYTLYFKLLEVKEKIQKEIEKNPMLKKILDEMEQQGSGSGQSGQSGESGESGEGGQSEENQPNNVEGAEQAAKEAQDAADKAKEQAQQAGDSGDEDADEKDELAKEAQAAADKAKEAAEKAKEAKENGDKDGEKKAAKEAKEQAQKAKDALNKIKGEDGKEGQEGKDDQDNKKGQNGEDGKEGQEGKDDQDNKKGQNGKNGKNGQAGQNSKDGGGKDAGNGHADILETPEELQKIKEGWKDLIDEYSKKIAGDFGEFIKKCKSSKNCEKNGLEVNVTKGSSGWNQKMDSYINAYVKKRVYQKKRQYQQTYTRVKRGSGFVEFGKPIKPGQKIKEEKLDISVAFYIDRSGSMGNSIDQVFKACYKISEALKKTFRRESVIDKIDFKLYAFNTSMIEIKYGNKCNAGGNTMGFHEILQFMDKNTDNFLINIIITDAIFDINESEVEKFMKNIEGMVLFITNNDNSTMKNLSEKYKTQLFYILANSNFEIQ